MSLRNTFQSYGTIAKTLHWLTAIGILTMVPLGLIAVDAPYASAEELTRKATLFSLHKTVGVTLFCLAVLRILWAIAQPKPDALHPERRVESFAAATVHWLLYGSLVAVPLSGWVHHAATDGFAPVWWPFGQSLPLVPKTAGVAEVAGGLHHVFLWALIAALALHVAGAVKHHLIDRDATLRRMLPGRSSTATTSSRMTSSEQAPSGGQGRGVHGAGAPVAALMIWAGFLALGGAFGVYGHGGTAARIAELQEVESDWQVVDGQLGLTISQFGQAVTGGFADWTAAITFDEREGTGPRGTVTVEVAIGSLGLGSVSAQAMGPDYFDTTRHPTAIFAAEIQQAETGLEAVGTLSVKGIEVPLTLPFVLDIADRTAQMQGQVSLDRRHFDIGEAMTDPTQLGFEVQISVGLTAQRQE
jgi:cytochrome b561/polyisoprenoid-binding protein YceI